MARKKALSFEMVVKGLAMRYDGKTYDEIASELGCGRTTIIRWLPRMERVFRAVYKSAESARKKDVEDVGERTDSEILQLLSRLLNQQEKILQALEEIKEKLKY